MPSQALQTFEHAIQDAVDLLSGAALTPTLVSR
jgi:hypothetical protein